MPKEPPIELIAAFREVLAYYPGLSSAAIRLEMRKSSGPPTMLARPAFMGLFGPGKARSYLIRIAPVIRLGKAWKATSDLPPDVLKGWIGHELGHIVDYQDRSSLGLVLFGIRYLLDPAFIRAAEWRADHFAVSRGLHAYILRTKRYILEEADIPRAYKRRIERYYSSPEQIEKLVSELEGSD